MVRFYAFNEGGKNFKIKKLDFVLHGKHIIDVSIPDVLASWTFNLTSMQNMIAKALVFKQGDKV